MVRPRANPHDWRNAVVNGSPIVICRKCKQIYHLGMTSADERKCPKKPPKVGQQLELEFGE